MSVVHQAFAVVKNRYRDSVALLRLSAEIGARKGITSSTVVMATAANLDNARDQGFVFDFERSSETDLSPSPNDVFVGVIGAEESCNAALEWAQQQLTIPTTSDSDAGSPEPPRSLRSAISRQPSIAERTSIAMISVPGRFAAAEAHKALQLGMHAMVFSDNVSLADEVEMKQYADQRGLLVMGPDCGTALISGVPFGFVNAMRRGPVAVVGASGTGMQEVMSRVHQQGSGISQAVGCGGRDLSKEVGATTMRSALRFVLSDSQTRAVVLVAKPVHSSVMRIIVEACQPFLDRGTPVVLAFTGFAQGQVVGEPRIHVARSLADAADTVVRLLGQDTLTPNPTITSPDLVAARRTIVGAFVGGTLCAEYEWLVRSSNPHVDLRCTDFGDDSYTYGRPHPMIDPTQRDAAITSALGDPSVALVHFDIVLGYGSADDPLFTLEPILRRHKNMPAPILTAHILGTDFDPQGKHRLVEKLQNLGVHTYDTNADAASVGSAIASRIVSSAP
jgi:FdrA protein